MTALLVGCSGIFKVAQSRRREDWQADSSSPIPKVPHGQCLLASFVRIKDHIWTSLQFLIGSNHRNMEDYWTIKGKFATWLYVSSYNQQAYNGSHRTRKDLHISPYNTGHRPDKVSGAQQKLEKAANPSSSDVIDTIDIYLPGCVRLCRYLCQYFPYYCSVWMTEEIRN